MAWLPVDSGLGRGLGRGRGRNDGPVRPAVSGVDKVAEIFGSLDGTVHVGVSTMMVQMTLEMILTVVQIRARVAIRVGANCLVLAFPLAPRCLSAIIVWEWSIDSCVFETQQTNDGE